MLESVLPYTDWGIWDWIWTALWLPDTSLFLLPGISSQSWTYDTKLCLMIFTTSVWIFCTLFSQYMFSVICPSFLWVYSFYTSIKTFPYHNSSQYLLCFFKSSSSVLLPTPFTSVICPLAASWKRQYLLRIWPIQLAFLLRILLISVLLSPICSYGFASSSV